MQSCAASLPLDHAKAILARGFAGQLVMLHYRELTGNSRADLRAGGGTEELRKICIRIVCRKARELLRYETPYRNPSHVLVRDVTASQGPCLPRRRPSGWDTMCERLAILRSRSVPRCDTLKGADSPI